MTKQKKAVVYRQGDVWLYKISSSTPSTLTRRRSGRAQPATGKGLILAEGEVTGHHHRIPVEEVQRTFLYPMADPGVRLLRVSKGKPVSLVHEEHETIKLPPGEYEVRIQREYEPSTLTRQTYVRD